MSDYFLNYASVNVFGALIFGIMLIHDMLSIDRQEKQLKYDHALIAFMLYFISDALWAGVDSGVLPVNSFTVLITNFSNFVLMTAITYTWLEYVMAVEHTPGRNDRKNRAAMLLPLAVSALALIITFFVSKELLIDDSYKTTGFFDAFLVLVPYIYIIAIIIYAIKKARSEENPIDKRRHLYIGFFPLTVVAGGLLQMILMPTLPIFCFSCAILMLIFYIQSMDGQISTDPLTKLNNRRQLMRYVAQKSNLHIEGRSAYVVMMDINNFKAINDNYGHAEGDRALIITANSLITAVRNHGMPIFVGRFGGDEFVMIAHPSSVEELEELILEIRENLVKFCESENVPYVLAIGAGFDKLQSTKDDSFQKCMQRADSKLYIDKERLKKEGKSTLLK